MHGRRLGQDAAQVGELHVRVQPVAVAGDEVGSGRVVGIELDHDEPLLRIARHLDARVLRRAVVAHEAYVRRACDAFVRELDEALSGDRKGVEPAGDVDVERVPAHEDRIEAHQRLGIEPQLDLESRIAKLEVGNRVLRRRRSRLQRRESGQDGVRIPRASGQGDLEQGNLHRPFERLLRRVREADLEPPRVEFQRVLLVEDEGRDAEVEQQMRRVQLLRSQLAGGRASQREGQVEDGVDRGRRQLDDAQRIGMRALIAPETRGPVVPAGDDKGHHRCHGEEARRNMGPAAAAGSIHAHPG